MDDKMQTDGRKDNAAQPLNASKNQAGAERYPSTRRDDGIDRPADATAPKQGAGDGSAPPAKGKGGSD